MGPRLLKIALNSLSGELSALLGNGTTKRSVTRGTQRAASVLRTRHNQARPSCSDINQLVRQEFVKHGLAPTAVKASRSSPAELMAKPG